MGRVVAGIPLVLVPALGAVQGGYPPDAWVWSGVVAAWAAALGALFVGGGALRRDWPWVVGAVALLLWTLASAAWSVEPRQSVLEARRMVVYAAVILALVVLARRGAAALLAAATHVAVTGLLAYALLRYLLGPRRHDPFELYVLFEPLGYANAIGILAAMGILLAFVPLLDRTPALRRAAAAATVPILALALTLSDSDASWLALALGLVTTAVLVAEPIRAAAAVAAVGIPSAPVVWLARHSEFSVTPAPRIGGAVLLGAAAVAAIAAGAAATALGSERPGVRSRRRPRRALVPAVVLALLVGGAIAVAAAGSRQPRSSYYHVAWHEYLAHPAGGSGAGTFGRYWLRSGLVPRWGGALDAHSLYVETLAELGPVGLLLVVGVMFYPLRRIGAARGVPGSAAVAGAAVAFLAHAGLDWDWELPAVVVAGLCCLAALLFTGHDDAEDALPSSLRAAAVLAAVALGLAAAVGAVDSTRPSAAENVEAPQSGASTFRVCPGGAASYLPCPLPLLPLLPLPWLPLSPLSLP